MSNPFKSSYRKAKLFKSQHEFEEFGKGKQGLVVCEKCQAVYYKKHWHHKLATLNAPEIRGLSKEKKKTPPINFVLCPACQMIKNRQYEGEIIIKNIPERLAVELENFVKGYCRRAYQRDPLDRLIGIKKSGNNWTVTVTENELANKLGKKIQTLFNNVKTRTSFMPEPSDVAKVVVEFLR